MAESSVDCGSICKPKQLGELMGDPDPEKSQRVMQAMLKMKKIIVADLQKAHGGG
jgi:hypothetical protein